MKTWHTVYSLVSVAGLAITGVTAQPERTPTQPTSPPRPTQPTNPNQPTLPPGRDPLLNQHGLGLQKQDKVTQQDLDKATRDWGQKQQEQLRKLTAKHGLPNDATSNFVAWKDAGQFKYITICKEEVAHNFPMQHTDFLMHAVSYRIPVERVGELIKFDGSIYVDRTAGCLAAKCDTEAHNLLGLNLAHDVLSGAKSADQARDEFARITADEKAGKMHPYLERLSFQPQTVAAGDPDQPHTARREANVPEEPVLPPSGG